MSLLAIFAEALPKRDLISSLKEAIAEWEVNPSDDNDKKVTMFCALLAQKEVFKMNGGMEKTMREMDQIKRIKERMDTEAQ